MKGALQQQQQGSTDERLPPPDGPALGGLLRSMGFWGRATSIYMGYKGTQARAALLKALGSTDEQIKQEVWVPQHEAAGRAMYELCVSLRGFYLKAGQFIGSRSDFVPEQICRQLSVLCDRVPPMPADAARAVLCRELRVDDLGDVFEWINLDKPLGAASISQVHKAKLRGGRPLSEADAVGLKSRRRWRGRAPAGPSVAVAVGQGQSAWDVCNLHGATLEQLKELNKGVDLHALAAGQRLLVPACAPISAGQGHTARAASSAAASTSGAGSTSAGGDGRRGSGRGQCREEGGEGGGGGGVTAVAAARRAMEGRHGMAPERGLVAVKVQYPNALNTMVEDLGNLRAISYFLSKTEIKFDLVSAVDELNKQIKLEFDFTREARVMDTIAHNLRPVSNRITIPRSVPGLVTRRVLVMEFVEGIPLTDLGSRVQRLSAARQRAAKKRILTRVSEAYGRMILKTGLFQADGHPGNILVGRGGRIGLLDYGQSKQLAKDQREGFAKLVLEMARGDAARISAALASIGVETETDNPKIRSEMAYGMFDTRGKVDPFSSDSPIKQSAINHFPPDMFFVLRVVQLLRGLADGMGVTDFSCAKQWAPLAREVLKAQAREAQPRRGPLAMSTWGVVELGCDTGRGVMGSLRNLITWPYLPPLQ